MRRQVATSLAALMLCSSMALAQAPGNKGGISDSGVGGQGQSLGRAGTPQQPASSQQPADTKGAAAAAATGSAERSVGTPTKADAKAGTEMPATPAAGKLSADQQARMRAALTQTRTEPTKTLDKSLEAGAKVPDGIDLKPLPADAAAIHPAYSGFQFFSAGSHAYIVDPASRTVVEMITLT